MLPLYLLILTIIQIHNQHQFLLQGYQEFQVKGAHHSKQHPILPKQIPLSLQEKAILSQQQATFLFLPKSL